MKQLVTTGRLAAVFTLTLAVSSTGCQSSGGSRWAWNPLKKSAGDEAAALADSSAPKLPSDGATPLVEGLPKAKPQPTMVAETKPQTPPAMAGIASTIEAVNAAVPKIDKPTPSSPSWSPNPTSVASAPTGIPAMPKTSPAPPASAVASMPYDPNGYKAASPPSSVVPSSTDRYGLGNRYASATPASAEAPAFGEVPPVAAAARAAGDRYGLTASTDKAAAAVSTTKQAANDFASQTQQTANSAVASAGSRYGAIAPVPVSEGTFPFGSAAPAAPATTVAQATSVPAPPTAPPAPAPAYPTPAYPTTKSVASTAPQGSAIGSLPPSTSVYASTQPITPIEPASATTTPQQESKSVVRLTTLPGEYRPGGTSTYRAAPATTGRY